MEVETPDASGVWGARSAAAAVLLSTGVVAPGVVLPAYARAGATVVLAFGVALSTRALASALLAFARREPPRPRPDDDLPSVSVVVTAYNEGGVLGATVEACLALDYPADALEVVVGYEAASTDGTGSVARRLAADHRRVAAAERPGPPGGKAAATNHALDHATGDLVFVLDADQRPEPGALRRAVRWVRDDDVWCVKGRCFGTNPRESVLALCATVERGLVERTEFYVRDLVGGFALFTGGQALFRTAALEDLGGFDESLLIEDVDMAYRIRRAGGEIRVDPGVVTRETNPTGLAAWWSQRRRWARGGMQVARRHIDRSLASGPPPLPARADFAATMAAVVALPLVALAAPLAAVALAVAPGHFPVDGPAAWLWAWVAVAPVLAASLLFALDARDGRRHDPVESAAVLLLWPYVGLQALAVVTAFVAEFVLDRESVYVTSTASSDD
ncbi:glycosyltransferase [Halobacterium jilantaiense]|uniref:Glycosyltransferase, catalytic subunit of cellulose synthase and poly-beta-1,6-N-acetylglucosamine synthase n=1 Tax=Halobacterium jilantaiense TaxID=355548 RepID=A0A1I0P975_9EURY|nr:glycosyltransferase family 2 protein [Halobacterium jilantaiense]SEW10618.1 Glycosyltransferase, catalytic subunit of cellulose synthase and poly-beta-1,6-N-acetylglucosamine synthase [Halobacterium jilantaiense]